MNPVLYVKGDATRPLGAGRRFIVHICNDQGGWGAGFVLALSRRWSLPEQKYREWFRGKLNDMGAPFELGQVQYVQVERDLWVVNMIAQTGYGPKNRGLHQTSAPNATPPIRYDALRKCLDNVGREAQFLGANVHCPRIGCGLAGGKWEEVEPILTATLLTRGVGVTVYDL
jgi:O-acetyl-ADP-ribose deacetylase (regulator of RNase III)